MASDALFPLTRQLDFTQLESPPAANVDKLVSESKFVDVVVENKTLKIYIEQVTNRDGLLNQQCCDLLFLHGMRFTSKNWLDIKSLYQVATWGHRAVAVDLPGFGKSICILEPEQKSKFLESLISTLGMCRPIIISPSMSGAFSLPYLFNDPSTSTNRAAGYVPVAPVFTSKYVDQMKKSQIPTLIVVGTNDKVNGKESTQDLQNLINYWYGPIEGASHPCYLDNPEAFDKLLYWFLKHLN
ncbi:Protein abhd14a [Bulinus truncatus]|nr:Protein abhd14a [Bulinus truncatus]